MNLIAFSGTISTLSPIANPLNALNMMYLNSQKVCQHFGILFANVIKTFSFGHLRKVDSNA